MRQHLALGTMVYVMVTLVQIPAVIVGLHALTGFWWFACVLIGGLFGSVPILGSLLGIEGAVNSWGWSVGASFLLFVGMPLLFLALGLALGAAKMRSGRGSFPGVDSL